MQQVASQLNKVTLGEESVANKSELRRVSHRCL